MRHQAHKQFVLFCRRRRHLVDVLRLPCILEEQQRLRLSLKGQECYPIECVCKGTQQERQGQSVFFRTRRRVPPNKEHEKILT
mmetsp:Transcript_4032/g.6898  ORF Transcript_4032/g.6898 Transcript_4032/m.6898 type:complete len:83 (-) Transcript_4032:1974-2222(-)